jgi:hypothetical protein
MPYRKSFAKGFISTLQSSISKPNFLALLFGDKTNFIVFFFYDAEYCEFVDENNFSLKIFLNLINNYFYSTDYLSIT